MLLVLEDCADDLNHLAVLRTCEALGVLRVWLVEAQAVPTDAQAQGSRRKLARRAAERGHDGYDPLLGHRGAQLYGQRLDVRVFADAVACLSELRRDGREVWVTSLDQEAEPLTADVAALRAELPERLAVVMGAEKTGVSAAMLGAADRLVFLPMHGFTESLNVSVATALVLQRLLDACPESRGQLPPKERDALRRQWYDSLARTEAQRREFAALADAGGATPFLDTRRAAAHRDEQRCHLAAGTRPKRGWPRGPRRRMAAEAAAEQMDGGGGAKEEKSGEAS